MPLLFYDSLYNTLLLLDTTLSMPSSSRLQVDCHLMICVSGDFILAIKRYLGYGIVNIKWKTSDHIDILLLLVFILNQHFIQLPST